MVDEWYSLSIYLFLDIMADFWSLCPLIGAWGSSIEVSLSNGMANGYIVCASRGFADSWTESAIAHRRVAMSPL